MSAGPAGWHPAVAALAAVAHEAAPARVVVTALLVVARRTDKVEVKPSFPLPAEN